ncbi:MAG: hypothetical protein V1895_01955 [Parcubacteria group bacterium]
MEDVCNNFSTTTDAVQLIEKAGGRLVAVMCLLNRSREEYFGYRTRDIPVLALEHKPMPQYRQDDPAVAEDIAAGNVVWKPKEEWQRLA